MSEVKITITMDKYNKYYLEKNPQSGEVAINNGEPVLGQLAKSDCPLEKRHVDILNKSWKKTGILYVKIEKKDNEDNKEKRKALFAEAKNLGIEGIAKNIKTEELEKLINEKRD